MKTIATFSRRDITNNNSNIKETKIQTFRTKKLE